jgi:hypothetical protein
MTTATITGNPARPYRDAQRIGDIAIAEALLRESHTERAGLIYILGELLTAAHRQAEILETIETALNSDILDLAKIAASK